MMTFPSAPPHHHHHHVHTRRMASASSESQPSSSDAKTQLFRSDAGTQLTDFSQIPQILRTCFRSMTSFTSPGHNPIWDFYFDISEWHMLPASAWTPALMFHLTNPCTKRKVLSLTKPKSKIYKTKSLSHYITLRVLPLCMHVCRWKICMFIFIWVNKKVCNIFVRASLQHVWP